MIESSNNNINNFNYNFYSIKWISFYVFKWASNDVRNIIRKTENSIKKLKKLNLDKCFVNFCLLNKCLPNFTNIFMKMFTIIYLLDS